MAERGSRSRHCIDRAISDNYELSGTRERVKKVRDLCRKGHSHHPESEAQEAEADLL